MVKTFEMDPTSNIWVILDLERDVQRGADDESTEEYGVRIATSLAYHFLTSTGCWADDGRRETVVLDPARGAQQYARVLESLAIAKRLEPFRWPSCSRRKAGGSAGTRR